MKINPGQRQSNHTPPLISDVYTPEEIHKFIFKAMMNTDTDSIYIKDPLGRLNFINKGMMIGLGSSDPNEIIGKTDRDIFGEAFGHNTFLDEQKLYQTGKPIANLVEMYEDQAIEEKWTHTTKIPLRNRSGEIIGLIGFTRSINEMKSTEQKLRNLSTHDYLTGVYNRNGLFERLKEMIQQTTNKLAVLAIDIDNLKQINDHYFHKTGDEFLKWFAWILKTTTRGNDIVARIGGDEFVLILEDIHHNVDVKSFCTKLYRNFNHSIDGRFQALGVSMSIGISIYPIDSSDPHHLIQMADEALYWAKNHGKGKIQFFNRRSDNQSANYAS